MYAARAPAVTYTRVTPAVLPARLTSRPVPMTTTETHTPSDWPQWQRILFRFFFIYLSLQASPWQWLGLIPGLGWLPRVTGRLDSWAVHAGNARLFHVRPVLVPLNGSGDTSYAWAQLWLYLSLALAGAALWTLLDRRHAAYPRLLYWLRTFVRYFVAANALAYGLVKLFMLQMVFPSYSQLATPLGDLLPMRLSWMFIGYSNGYQQFAGLIEVIAGLLLLRRNTITLGLMIATGAFTNVWLINLSYDVPVKLYAMHLLLASVFLLVLDARRLIAFLVLNRAAPGTTAYEPHYRERWHHWAAASAKGLILIGVLVLPVINTYGRYRTMVDAPAGPIAAGVYDVPLFVRNGDTVPLLVADSLRWHDLIIDGAHQGSVGSVDSTFWQRYRRGYFRYAADSVHHTMAVWKTSARSDSTFLFSARWERPAPDTLRLWAKVGPDSLYAVAVRSTRHFQLAERQFHWLSEYNR
jgi:hypothetical protein